MSNARVMTVLSCVLGVTSCADTPRHGDAAPEAAVEHRSSREAVTPAIDSMVADGRFKGELWRMNLSERNSQPTHASRLAVDGDLVIVQDQKNEIHALDRSSGVHRWIVQLAGPTTQSIGGTASTATFVSTDELVGVDRVKGARRQARSSQHLDFFPSGRAVTIGTTAFVGRLAPMGVQTINLSSGATGWEYNVSSPLVDLVSFGDGALAQLIGVTEDGLLFALPPRGATDSAWSPPESWFHRVPGTHVVTPLALHGNSLCFGAENGFLYHVDARSGRIVWKMPCGTDMRGNEAVIAGNAIYQYSSGTLYAFAADTGKSLWNAEGALRLITRIGDLCYLDMGNHHVSVRRAANGVEVASFNTTGFDLVPSIQGGGMFIASDGENVFALN
jgi:outer membrane protein assembly factor BamB